MTTDMYVLCMVGAVILGWFLGVLSCRRTIENLRDEAYMERRKRHLLEEARMADRVRCVRGGGR